jgi:hypothetical protein
MGQKQQIHTQRLGQRLAVAVVLSLVLLIGGVIGLDVGIRQSVVVPPDLDISFNRLRIVAYTTNPYPCLCPGATRHYRVLWMLHESAPHHIHEIWHRILTVPLQR